MAYGRRNVDEGFAARVGALIVACTAALTLSFFGLVSFASGQPAGIEKRIPLYVLGMAVSFVVSVVTLDQRRREGVRIIAIAAGVAVATLLLLLLGGEGAIYAARNPETALQSRRFLYLVAAGLIATGLGYWSVRHWRDVAGSVR